MLVRLNAAALRGVDAVRVTVEVRVDRGIHFLMVGLPDSAIRESQQRIKSAIEHLGYRWPGQGITINLAPAGLRKEGAAYDLPLALGILAASGQIESEGLSELLTMGELALDGTLRPVRGALALAQVALSPGLHSVVLPCESAQDAAMLQKVNVLAAAHLGEVLDHLNGTQPLPRLACDLAHLIDSHAAASLAPLAGIHGQTRAIEAMALAAAGGHNVCMIGPPGAGKTMLARAMIGLLPPLDVREALEVNRIHSVAHIGPRQAHFERPFRSPHHTISDVALVGGGSDPRPGEISLAHAGVLFLDELPEMPRHVLEVLRQPLESREITVSRARATVVFPADFQLIAAMNPCPCGRFTSDPKRRQQCSCSRHARQRYLEKVSGPLLDRIDIHLNVAPVDPTLLLPKLGAAGRLAKEEKMKAARALRNQVLKARAIQRQRNPNGETNHRLSGDALHDIATLCSDGRALLTAAAQQLEFSARAHQRILRMARTSADLNSRSQIALPDLVEAIAFRRAGAERTGPTPTGHSLFESSL